MRARKEARKEGRYQAEHHWNFQCCFGHTLRTSCQDPYRRSDKPRSTSAKRTEVRTKSSAARSRQRRNNTGKTMALCLYCGGKDHILENCPLTKTKRPPFDDNVKFEPKNK